MNIHESYTALKCFDSCFQRNLNLTYVQRIGNAHVRVSVIQILERMCIFFLSVKHMKKKNVFDNYTNVGITLMRLTHVLIVMFVKL